jgi:Kef-type K+ transport system membrane component KefB
VPALPHEPFAQIALLLIASALAGAVLLRLRQPLLLAYLVVGIAAGPAGFRLVQAEGSLDVLAQIGVAVLLFVVGLRLDLQHVRSIGPVALATGLGQLAFTVVIGYLLTLLLGKSWLESLYVAVALTFSSTIIIVKLLSDKRELDSLHGRIAVGFLIVQDLAVVLAMMAMSALQGTGEGGGSTGALWVAASLLGRLAAAAALLYVLMRWILPRIVSTMARSQELLLVFAVAWGVALAALGEWAGFSKEAGAFLAGFSLASTPYREAMSARLTALRDFLLLFFFIDMGARLELDTLGAELLPAAVLSAFVLVGNPLIVMAIMGWMGYRKRTGFMAGLTVAQISEFSIVFVAMGITLGHVGVNVLSLTTLVGMVTITLSTYMILYSQPLYERLAPWLVLFERQRPVRELAMEQHPAGEDAPEVVVFGLGRYGARLLSRLRAEGVDAIGCDFDPDAVRLLRRRGLPVFFGDAEDPALLSTLPLASARCVVSALPEWQATQGLVAALREAGFGGRIAAVLREAGPDPQAARSIDILLHPFDDAADHAARHLMETLQRQETRP